MKALVDRLRDEVAKKISSEMEKTFQEKSDPKQLVSDLAMVPKLEMGHLAFPCFRFSKTLKKKPNEIAQQLAEAWGPSDLFSEVRAVGPFLNFFLKNDFYASAVLQPMLDLDYFSVEPDEANPYLIEYSQPNTHKELHVGHMRNLCFGHSLVRLFKYCGNNVVTCTFPGDVGTHVAKCLWFLKYHNQEKIPETHKGEWLGRLYSAGHNKLEDEKGTDKEEENRKQLTDILKQLEQKKGEFYDLWIETREWSIELMNSVYQWAGVSFDRWFWESEVDSSSVKLVKELHSQGKLEESEGAIGLDLSDEKLGFCMLLKSDGNGMYATKDLDLMRLKFAEYEPQKNIYIVDMRQELHFKQVMSVFERLGFGEAKKSLHLKYNFVELPDGAMSSRKGNIVPINDLIQQMQEIVKKEHLERYKGEWEDSEIDSTAEMVAKGAINYGMNRMDSNKKIVFDMKEWLRLDGESGPYIQYSHARICSIIRKQGDPELTNIKWDLLSHASEQALIIKLSQFQLSMFRTLDTYKTSGICNYVYELSKVFNSFYHDCPIAKAESEDLKVARLALATAVKNALAQGLDLLGVPAPARM